MFISNDDLGKQIVTKGCDILYFDSLHTEYRIFKISKESYDSIVPPLFTSFTHCFYCIFIYSVQSKLVDIDLL